MAGTSTRMAPVREGGGAVKPYYEDAAVQIFHGDCREILPRLDPVDVVFTSPPYNKGWRGDHRNGWEGIVNTSSKAARFRNGYGPDTTDALPWPEYESFISAAIGQAWQLIRPAGALYLNHKPRVWMGRFWSPIGLLPPDVPLRQIITWVRGGAIDVSECGYATFYEWLMFCPKPEFHVDMAASARGDVWTIPQDRSNTGHPAPFPVDLPKRAMAASPQADVWLDPFMGTGSTLRAAKDLGHRAIGIETEEHWCEVAANRMAQAAMALR